MNRRFNTSTLASSALGTGATAVAVAVMSGRPQNRHAGL
jgi:hypothetical protein